MNDTCTVSAHPPSSMGRQGSQHTTQSHKLCVMRQAGLESICMQKRRKPLILPELGFGGWCVITDGKRDCSMHYIFFAERNLETQLGRVQAA